MKKLLVAIVVFAGGFAVGTLFSKKRHEDLATTAQHLWRADPVEDTKDAAFDTVRTMAAEASALASDTVRRASDFVSVDDPQERADRMHAKDAELGHDAEVLSGRADAESSYGSDVLETN